MDISATLLPAAKLTIPLANVAITPVFQFSDDDEETDKEQEHVIVDLFEGALSLRPPMSRRKKAGINAARGTVIGICHSIARCIRE